MRLIDADLLKECYAGTNALDGKADYMSIRKMIDNQPTSYDVEKVVAELEEVKNRYCFMGYQMAIDIVRKGGME